VHCKETFLAAYGLLEFPLDLVEETVHAFRAP
jgi:hypothetical protein